MINQNLLRSIAIAGLSCLFVLSCATRTSEKIEDSHQAKAQNSAFIAYVNTNETSEYKDVSAISIVENENSGSASYVVDRYEGTKQLVIAMDFGNYVIEGTKITITTKKYSFVGTIEGDKIVIDGKVYTKKILQKP